MNNSTSNEELKNLITVVKSVVANSQTYRQFGLTQEQAETVCKEAHCAGLYSLAHGVCDFFSCGSTPSKPYGRTYPCLTVEDKNGVRYIDCRTPEAKAAQQYNVEAKVNNWPSLGVKTPRQDKEHELADALRDVGNSKLGKGMRELARVGRNKMIGGE